MAAEAQRRWRLVLGRYASEALGALTGRDSEMDLTLDFLYSREYEKRGIRRSSGPGSLDRTQMTAIKWVGRARELFPESVFEVLQDHALNRYALTELLSDPKTLEELEPNQDLLRLLLAFHGRAQPEMKAKLRAVANRVIQDIVERLRTRVQQAFSGRRNRYMRSNISAAANFDWRATIRANLRNFDRERGKIIADRIRFNSRQKRRLPWRIILCVDQSGSMTDSIIHSAVMASIFSGLPGVTVKMVLFDTSIIDVSDKLADPLETLLSVQLGGGTDIGRAVSYCERLVEDGDRTAFILISDFCEGAPPRALFAAVARLAEARVKLIGLGALDDTGQAAYDSAISTRLADLGMHVGTMTPDRLAEWLAGIMR